MFADCHARLKARHVVGSESGQFGIVLDSHLQYQEGQRVEATFVSSSHLTVAGIQHTATVAREIHLLFMSHLVGWQHVDFERWGSPLPPSVSTNNRARMPPAV